MKIAHSERLLKAARVALEVIKDLAFECNAAPGDEYNNLREIIIEIDRDQRDGQP